nr:CDP-alcohol phosphatidyltransferase family protein [Eubacterium sp.]
MSTTKTNSVKKIIPSKLETGFQQFLYKHVGKYIPASMTPNQVTMIGALGGLFAIICTLLTHISFWFFIGTIVGILVHLIADDLDGYVARSRNMSSQAGAYFDLITDVLFSTFFLVAFGLSPYASIELVAFAAPVYGIINVTAMNYIIYCNEFLFPRIGPIEAHMMYVAVAILSMIFHTGPIFILFGFEIMIADVIVIVGLIPTYYEMIRLEVQLFRRLKEKEK